MREVPPLPNRVFWDFDSTIADTRWNGETFQMHGLLPGMKEAVNQCSTMHEVVIFTSRPRKEYPQVRKFLSDNGVIFSRIMHKPLAIAYVDDRGLSPQQAKDYFKPEPPDDGKYDS